MKISITLETMSGVTWPIWKRLVSMVDTLGFHTVFRSDHFPMGDPPVTSSIDLITSLTYLADHTRQVNFGTLVAPISVRDPVMLSREAMSLNDLSGGRMILGVGAGWADWDHKTFGYHLGDIKTRMDRLEEGLHVISSLTRSEAPVSFEGRFYRLNNARLLPRPQHPTRILVGGNGEKRTLPLVARYADLWNCQVETPERFRELSHRLDDLILAEGRRPEDVTRTVMNGIMIHRSAADLERHLQNIQSIAPFADWGMDQFLGFSDAMKVLRGSPDQVLEKLHAYAEAGVQEFVIQWFICDDYEGLEEIAQEILPHFQSQPV